MRSWTPKEASTTPSGVFWEDEPGEEAGADTGADGAGDEGSGDDGAAPEGGSEPGPEAGTEEGAGDGGDEGASGDEGAEGGAPEGGSEWDGSVEGLAKVEGWDSLPEKLRTAVTAAVTTAASDRAEITRLLTGGHEDLQKAINEAAEAVREELAAKHQQELEALRSGKVSAEDSYKGEIQRKDTEIATLKQSLAEKDALISAYEDDQTAQYEGAITSFLSENAPGVEAALKAGKPEVFDFFVEVLASGERLGLPKHLPDAMKAALDFTRVRFPDEARAPRQPQPLPKHEEIMAGPTPEADDTPPGMTMHQRLRAARREA